MSNIAVYDEYEEKQLKKQHLDSAFCKELFRQRIKQGLERRNYFICLLPHRMLRATGRLYDTVGDDYISVSHCLHFSVFPWYNIFDQTDLILSPCATFMKWTNLINFSLILKKNLGPLTELDAGP